MAEFKERLEAFNAQLKEMQEKGVINLPIVIPLQYPIQVTSDSTFEEFTVEKHLTAAAYKGIPASNLKYDDMQKLTSRMVAQPMSTIEKLHSLDMFRCFEVVNLFLPDGLKTGDNL